MSTDRKIVIAIDGYSSSGKSTMARALARRLGYRYIDSGAMYRAVTLYAIRHNLIDDTEALVAALPDIGIDFAVNPDGTQSTLLNGENVEKQIRSMEVSNLVSRIAAIPTVRRQLVQMQQAFGTSKGIVMDGRDIGTTVFPDAELKIFVDASPMTRAQRRYDELHHKGDTTVTFDEILDNIRQRDHIDTTRAESPLRRADDAVLFDNSNMTIDEQNSRLDQIVEHAIAGL